MNVTTVTEQVRALFGFDHAALNSAVAKTPAGSDGLVLLPYFAGERTPNVPAGTGTLLGLDARTMQAGHLARASMEGATMGMNYGLRRLMAMGLKPKEIRVTGGGAKSAVWRQIMADIFGVPVVGMVEEEGAAVGGALQAAWCVALRNGNRKAKLASLTDRVVAVDENTRCRPDPKSVRQYQKLQSLQDELSLSLRSIFDKRRALLGA
jgi:sugar (pentulose or hexulose) kinase